MNLDPQQHQALQQALQQLHGLHLPEPVGWWPLAFTWWVLFLSLGAMLLALIWFWIDRRKRHAYRREALQKLREINASMTPAEQIQQLNALLKQVAITAYGRHSVAALNDQDWLAFLHRSAQHIPQPPSLGGTLQAAYRPADSTQELQIGVMELRGYVQHWIKGHHF
ncbi:DUF4381 domain-containing protein [Thiomicrorhabdus cannonii]|uniref:DUF4381 domain-containing protein n=1 Tax=Thiomicrorhabdus cannonii TaxID=2748011 RepID=UPI0015BF4FEB|nr:DUF4381 domain-containing protein [Thiomicrorhabdus cannonii]